MIPDFIVGNIPQRMRPGVLRYIMDGIPPGDFLTAIFENNFYEAICMADSENRTYFREYAMMLNAVPMGCWGSREVVNQWIRVGGLHGIQREKEGKEDEPSGDRPT